MLTNGVPPPAALLQMMTGYWVSKAVSVAAELAVADLLKDGPRASDDLAAATGVRPEPLYRLLRALASVGVFTEDDERRFALTPLADLLRSDVPGSMRALARMYGSEQYRAWDGLLESIRTGQPAFDHAFGSSYFDYLEQNDDASAVFNEAMTGWTTQVAESVVAAYDFPESGTVVDVGGGHGLLLTTILKARPALRGILFDLPHVVTETQPLLEKAGVANRSSIVGGDFFASVPEGTVYVLAQILHDWDDQRCQIILGNCRNAIRAEGRLLVVEQVLPRANEPALGKWLDLHMLVLLTGRERTEAEYRTLLRAAGFELVRVIPTQSGAGILEAVPA